MATLLGSVVAGNLGAGTCTAGPLDCRKATFLVALPTATAAETFSDDQGNVWTATPRLTTGGRFIRFYWCSKPKHVANLNITCAAAGVAIIVAAFSNVKVLAYTGEDAAFATAGTSVTNNIVPPVSGLLILNGLALPIPNTDLPTAGGGFTLVNRIAGDGVNHGGAIMSFQQQSSKTTVAPTFGWTNAANATSLAPLFTTGPTVSGGVYLATGTSIISTI